MYYVNVWFRQHRPVKKYSNAQNFREAIATGKSAYIQLYIDSQYYKIANTRRGIRRKYTQTASILFCVYIKRHSPSPRDNATMRRVAAIVSCIYRLHFLAWRLTTVSCLNSFSEQHPLLTTLQGSSLRSFFTTSRLLFSDVIPHVCFINHPPAARGNARFLFSTFSFAAINFFFYQARTEDTLRYVTRGFLTANYVQNCINNSNNNSKINIIWINVQDCEK